MHTRTLVTALTLLLAPAALCAPNPLDGSDIVFHRKGPDTLSRYGWQNVMSVGDINSDGFADFAFTTARPNYTSLIFLGGNPPDTVEDYSVQGNVWATGDFTGDGIAEVVSSRVYIIAAAPQGVVYFYRGFGDSLASQPYDSMWSPGYNGGKGQVVRAARVDGDSLADLLICQPDVNDGPKVLLYSGGIAFDTIPEWSVGPRAFGSHYLLSRGNFGFVDWNGDGRQDVYVGWHARLDSIGYVGIYFGPDFGSEPDRILGTPADSGINYPREYANFVAAVGDVDGDGFDDLAVDSYDHMLIYAGGPEADTVYDYGRVPRSHRAAAAGDVNGDGANDLVLGFSHRHAQGGIEVLLGGSEWDEASDGWLTRSMLPPYFLDAIGYRVASAGDVDNDGYTDLLFSTFNLTNDDVGDVFVALGGPDIVTGIADPRPAQILPASFALHQNFPNPFNPATEIAFDLPRASTVSLTVYDLLGRQVARLFDRQPLSAGTHRVSWNGAKAASGIYLYRLDASTFSATRKMLLLR